MPAMPEEGRGSKREDQGQDLQQVGRGPEPPRFLCWKPLREENFHRNIVRAQNRPEFTP